MDRCPQATADVEETLEIDDLMLVSVDDHTVEPPDMFSGHIPARYAGQAPEVATKDDAADAWLFKGLSRQRGGQS